MSAPEELLVDLVRRVVREELQAQHAPASAADPLLSVAAAAERIAMSPTFIRDAIDDGRLPARQVGRAVRVLASDVDALAARPRRRRAVAAHEAVTDPEELARQIRARAKCGAR